MIQRLLICLSLFIWVLPASAQKYKVYTPQDVKRMAVFPGCENENPNDKTELAKCLSHELSVRLGKELKEAREILTANEMYEAKATLEFILSKEGIILDVSERPGNHPILGPEAVEALEKVAAELPPIRPATIKKDIPVDMVYRLPIVLRVNQVPPIKMADFPVDEIVLFSLVEEDGLRYEVRLFKSRDIKVFELDNGNYTFLGKFLSMNELESSEPYKSLMQENRKAKRVLIADGELDDGFYEIYMHNLFKNNPKEPIFVEIVKVENEVRTTVKEFEKEEDFNQSKFAPLIYRE